MVNPLFAAKLNLCGGKGNSLLNRFSQKKNPEAANGLRVWSFSGRATLLRRRLTGRSALPHLLFLSALKPA
jgi:hypothetical protein